VNKRLLSVLGFALVISAIASLVLYRLIVTKLAANAKPAMTQVVVATHNLEVGSMIKDLDVKIVDWNGPVPKGAVSNPADTVGRGVVETVYEGEPLLDSRLAAKGAGAGLAAMIPPGMRAVTIRVNDVTGVSGFVRPGMRVDVLIEGNPPGATSNTLGTLSKTLLQNMEVLSAGQDIQKDSEGKPVNVPVVNLLVTPEQAETLSLASNETRIQLVLRNPLDTQPVKTPGTAVSNLFTGMSGLPENKTPAAKPVVKRPVAQTKPVTAAAPPEAPKVVIPLTVEVITGTSRAETKFKPEEGKQ